MDEQSQKYLNDILAKEPNELTPEQIGFLKARISYVGKNSRAKFAEVLQADTPKDPQDPSGKQEADNQDEQKEKKTTDTSGHPGDNSDDQDGDEE